MLGLLLTHNYSVGAPFLTGVSAADTWSPSKEILSHMVPYDFSDRLRQYHCSKCGTIMFTRVSWSVMDANKGVHFDVMSGTLERFDGFLEIAAHEFVADTLDGGFADFLTTVSGAHIERWSHRPWKSDQLRLYWQSPDSVPPKACSSNMLRARCKCGGVQFWISRPHVESKNAIGMSSDRTSRFRSRDSDSTLQQLLNRSHGGSWMAVRNFSESCVHATLVV